MITMIVKYVYIVFLFDQLSTSVQLISVPDGTLLTCNLLHIITSPI